MVKSIKPELLAPAGDWPALQTAIKYGADAVYFGIKGFNMRHFAGNFEVQEMKKVTSLLHQNNKKGYLALNTILYNNEIDKARSILKEAKKSNVDAVILWDMGLFRLARESGLVIHLSTQASVSNFESIKYYSELGARRVVLARECRLSHIKEIIKGIKKEKLNIEIEVFVHGAMCVSLSGRCFMSENTFRKSANRGKCLQSCRREYVIAEVNGGDNRYILGKDYILSSKDICAIDIIDRLIESGVSAFKIEGRMRSPEYVREVTCTYREAIDAHFKGSLDDKKKKAMIKRLKNTYNRGLSTGFLLDTAQNTGSKIGKSKHNKVFLGEVVKFYKNLSVAAIMIRKGPIKKGQKVLIYGKNTPADVFKVNEIHVNKSPVKEAHKGTEAGIKVPFKVRRHDKVFRIGLEKDD